MLDLDTDDLRVSLTATVTHRPGAIRLDGYPLLVHAPAQHGPGVWLEDGTASVGAVLARFETTPDAARVADHFGTTPAHVLQAITFMSDEDDDEED